MFADFYFSVEVSIRNRFRDLLQSSQQRAPQFLQWWRRNIRVKAALQRGQLGFLPSAWWLILTPPALALLAKLLKLAAGRETPCPPRDVAAAWGAARSASEASGEEPGDCEGCGAAAAAAAAAPAAAAAARRSRVRGLQASSSGPRSPEEEGERTEEEGGRREEPEREGASSGRSSGAASGPSADRGGFRPVVKVRTTGPDGADAASAAVAAASAASASATACASAAASAASAPSRDPAPKTSSR